MVNCIYDRLFSSSPCFSLYLYMASKTMGKTKRAGNHLSPTAQNCIKLTHFKRIQPKTGNFALFYTKFRVF